MRRSEIIQILKRYNIPFYITGSYAVELYTGVKRESDVDFCVRKYDLPKIFKLIPDTRKVFHKKKKSVFKSLKADRFEFSAFDYFPLGISFKITKKRMSKCKLFKVDGYVCDVVPVEDLLLMKLLLYKSRQTISDKEDIQYLIKSHKLNLLKMILKSTRAMVLGQFLSFYTERDSVDITIENLDTET